MSYKSDIQKHTYEELLPGYQKLEKIVEELLQSAFRQHDIKIMQLPHRITCDTCPLICLILASGAAGQLLLICLILAS